MVYYNEHDLYAAQWLRNLIDAGLIADGWVDDRSIMEVKPDDLTGFTQCHFFAGIGGWSVALRLAGWGDDRPVWTGSCPCQPFSAAGKQRGTADERHLWPEFMRLIAACRPSVVFGEQVSAKKAIGGNIAAKKDVQRVLDEQAFVRVLQEQVGPCEDLLSALQQRTEQEATGGELLTSESCRERQDPCCCGQVSRGEDGTSVRSGCRGDSKADRCGNVRADGNCLRPEDTEVLEHTVTGSDYSGSGLHEGQCASRSLCDERHVSHMGTEQGDPTGGSIEEPEDCPLERLIRTHRDSAQEATPDWLAGVRADLGAAGYSFGACVMAASSVGAPHIRQRLFWVADSACERWHGGEDSTGATRWRGTENRGWLGDSISSRSQGHTGHGDGVSESGRLDEGPAGSASQAGCPGGVSDTEHAAGSPERLDDAGERSDAGPADGAVSRDDCGRDFWQDCRVVACRDGKARRIGPSTSVLAHGVQRGLVELCSGEETHTYNRVGALKGFGNAIVPQVAAAFIRAAT